MQTAYINRVATVVPPYDVHDAFRRFARSLLNDDRRNSLLFQRMADESGIEHRYSCLEPRNLPEDDCIDAGGFYLRGNFPDTAMRMQRFEQYAPPLAQAALDRLQLGAGCDRITHLLVSFKCRVQSSRLTMSTRADAPERTMWRASLSALIAA